MIKKYLLSFIVGLMFIALVFFSIALVGYLTRNVEIWTILTVASANGGAIEYILRGGGVILMAVVAVGAVFLVCSYVPAVVALIVYIGEAVLILLGLRKNKVRKQR